MWAEARWSILDILTKSGALLAQERMHEWHWEMHPMWWWGWGLGIWKVLYDAQRAHTLATTGPDARVRHPQYDGFILIMLGFLLQWRTLITLIMFPVLVAMYVRLARREERDVTGAFGETYLRYAAVTPRFFPKLRPENRHDAVVKP